MTLEPLYHAVAYLLVHIYYGVSPVLGKNSGASWAVSVVLLTVAMRLVLFPVFVKQIRSQRAMQALQPRMKELQAKYKNDKETLNKEMMALWKESGTNPLSGCLPMLLQIPIFIALYHVLTKIRPQGNCLSAANPACYDHLSGFPQSLMASAAQAKIFGVPFAAAFDSSSKVLHLLDASQTSTRILCGVLTLIMVVTTFITQRQLMARNTATGGSQMAQQQKILLYIFPLFFLFYGYKFPIGVLFYWLTSNLWSMGQQFVVIRRMDAAPATPPPAGPSGPAPGAKPVRPAPGAPPAATKPVPLGPGSQPAATAPPNRNRPSGKRRPSGRNRNKRGRRR